MCAIVYSSTEIDIFSTREHHYIKYIIFSKTDLVHAPGTVHADGRHSAIRRLLHRVVLHLLGHLREPVLLSLRIPLSRFRHPRRLVLADQHRHGLFPAMRRELPLVVEVLLRVRRIGSLRLRLLRLLLLHQAGHRRVCADLGKF